MIYMRNQQISWQRNIPIDTSEVLVTLDKRFKGGALSSVVMEKMQRPVVAVSDR